MEKLIHLHLQVRLEKWLGEDALPRITEELLCYFTNPHDSCNPNLDPLQSQEELHLYRLSNPCCWLDIFG